MKLTTSIARNLEPPLPSSVRWWGWWWGRKRKMAKSPYFIDVCRWVEKMGKRILRFRPLLERLAESNSAWIPRASPSGPFHPYPAPLGGKAGGKEFTRPGGKESES
jgi:hypothetical protein